MEDGAFRPSMYTKIHSSKVAYARNINCRMHDKYTIPFPSMIHFFVSRPRPLEARNSAEAFRIVIHDVSRSSLYTLGIMKASTEAFPLCLIPIK